MDRKIQIKNSKEKISHLKKEINNLLENHPDRQAKDSLYKLDMRYDTLTNTEDVNFEELKNLEDEIFGLYNSLLKLENDSIKQNISDLNKTVEQIQKKLDDANQKIKYLKNGQDIKTKKESINTFSKSINEQKNKFIKDVRFYSISFIISLVLIGILLIISFLINNLQTLEWYSIWGIRLSITLPGLAIVSFLYFNYRLCKIQLIRYSHIYDLVDCGYEYFRFVLNDEQLSINYMKRILDNFLELKELSVIVRNEKNPAEKYLMEILNAIKSLKASLKNKN